MLRRQALELQHGAARARRRHQIAFDVGILRGSQGLRIEFVHRHALGDAQ